MDAVGITQLLLASISIVLSSWLAWFWWLPMLQRLSQWPIRSQLARMPEIGFNLERTRCYLFVAEIAVLSGLLVFNRIYLGPALSIVLCVVLYHARSLILTWMIECRERLLRQQTLSFATGLQGLMQSGETLPRAITQLACETPAPLGRQITKVANNYRLGRPLTESISEVRSMLRLDAFSLLVTSVTCAMQHGTELSQALIGVRETLEHRDQAERQLRAKTSSARRTILILSCTPLFFFVMFWVMMAESMSLIFLTSSGKVLLAVIVLLHYIGVAWARRLMLIPY